MSSSVHPAWERERAHWPHPEVSRFVRSGSIAWHIQRMGSGDPILLIHGAGGATMTWRGLMPILAKEADVIAIDLPGQGFTRAPAGGVSSLPAMADALSALLDDLAIRPSLIIGHSAGAAVALRMVLDGSAAPRIVVGINAALLPFQGAAGILFPQIAKTVALNPFSPWLFAQMSSWSSQARRMIEGMGSTLDDEGVAIYTRLLSRADHISGALEMMASWDLEPLSNDLLGLKTQTLLLSGSADQTIAPEQSELMAHRYPNITAREIPNLGHLMHEEAPELIAQHIAELREMA